MTAEDFAADLDAPIAAAREGSLSDEAVIDMLADTVAALRGGGELP